MEKNKPKNNCIAIFSQLASYPLSRMKSPLMSSQYHVTTVSAWKASWNFMIGLQTVVTNITGLVHLPM